MSIPWVDKYRPKLLRDIKGHNDIKKVLEKSINKCDLPHLLFHGNAGVGKTSTVWALAMQLYGPKRINQKILELNASDENGINVVRGKIINFARIAVGSNDPNFPSPSFKLVILDEADSMTGEAQTALKRVMEETCDITRFIFICNYENKIIEPIKSRCASFKFNSIPNEDIIQHLKHIAAHEHQRKINDDVFDLMVAKTGGDVRQCIMILQNISYINPDVTVISCDNLCDITSWCQDKDIAHIWNVTLTCNNMCVLYEEVNALLNQGFVGNDILELIVKRVINCSEISDSNKVDICQFIAKIERMLTIGTDAHLHSVFAFINAKQRNLQWNF